MAILSKPLLFKLDDDKCDMEFQFVGNDDDEEYVPSLKKAKTTKKTQLCDKLEVLRAHKLLLSYISPVLHTQFYESMHENGRVDIVGGLEIVRLRSSPVWPSLVALSMNTETRMLLNTATTLNCCLKCCWSARSIFLMISSSPSSGGSTGSRSPGRTCSSS